MCYTSEARIITRFVPMSPAKWPFVTSAGGAIHIEPKHTIDLSSGGFSDHFLRPMYQEAAMSAGSEGLGDTWKGLFGPAGGGFPDFVAQVHDLMIVEHSKEV